VAALAPLVNLYTLELPSTGITTLAFTSGMSNLTVLNASFNQIVSVTPLQGSTALYRLDLDANPISDIAALVANAGLGSGDTVHLAGTSLSCDAQAANVTALVNRGVTVTSPCN
jgi:Leucine-rich repeat (LRR) protein